MWTPNECVQLDYDWEYSCKFDVDISSLRVFVTRDKRDIPSISHIWCYETFRGRSRAGPRNASGVYYIQGTTRILMVYRNLFSSNVRREMPWIWQEPDLQGTQDCKWVILNYFKQGE
jgi:hypothetical protein